VPVLVDGVFALTEGVPELDGAVAGARDDLAVVRGEGDGENILGMSNKSSGGSSKVEIPQSQGSIP